MLLAAGGSGGRGEGLEKDSCSGFRRGGSAFDRTLWICSIGTGRDQASLRVGRFLLMVVSAKWLLSLAPARDSRNCILFWRAAGVQVLSREGVSLKYLIVFL